MKLFSEMRFKGFSKKGFTLVELLVVIAILGVLAAAVLVAINPVEQIARGNDSGRKTTISQLGNALQAYYTVLSVYPTENATWLDSLVTAGELKAVPPVNPSPNPGCTGGRLQYGYCYKQSGGNAVVYVLATSKTEKLRATGTGAACADTTYVVWSSLDGGKTGVYCSATQPGETSALGTALK